MSLCSFIKNTKAQFFSRPDRFHLSVGNKACDLDSMVSALSFAYFNSLVGSDKWCYVGIIPIPIEEFRLRYWDMMISQFVPLTFRTEATYLFGEVGIEQANLIDLDLFNSQIQVINIVLFFFFSS